MLEMRRGWCIRWPYEGSPNKHSVSVGVDGDLARYPAGLHFEWISRICAAAKRAFIKRPNWVVPQERPETAMKKLLSLFPGCFRCDSCTGSP